MSSPSDKILVRGLKATCILGVPTEERKFAQEILIDLELFTDAGKAAQSDRLQDAIDYEKICHSVTEHVRGTKFHLLEALAESVAELIFKSFAVEELTVRVFKPKILKNTKKVGVEIHRKRG